MTVEVVDKLLELKEQHYRGYINDEQYIDKVNEILDNYVEWVNENII